MIGGVTTLGEDLGVSGVRDSRFVQRLLVQGKGHDRVDAAIEREVDRGREEVVSGLPGAAIDEAGLDVGEFPEATADR